MKIVAIVANAAQLAIILLILFVRGLELGNPVILMLFLLMAIPFINVLTIVLDNRPFLERPWQSHADNEMVKREAVRIRYRQDRYPVLETGGSTFAVRDLSEGGVRIMAASTTPLKNRIHGEIQLLCGERLRFKARILRKEDGDVIFRFSQPIGTAILMGEKQAVTADRSA